MYPLLITRLMTSLQLIILIWTSLMFLVITIHSQEIIDKAIEEVFPTISPILSNTENCICVPYYLCNNQTISTDGIGLIDFRNNPCNGSIETCCYDRKESVETTISPVTEKRTICGHWNPGGVGFRIFGQANNEAQFGEYPWMIAFFKLDSNSQSESYLCGGSLIHPQVVLTAVHHINNKNLNEIVVRAGEWDLQTENEIFPYQNREISKVIFHEKFNDKTLYNDVALVFLTQPFVLTDNVGTVCLPPRNFQFNTERCYSSGWGKDFYGKEGINQVILKSVNLPIVSHSECLRLLRETRLGSKFILHDSFLCAGGEIGKDTCKGDGGGPLVCPVGEYSEQFHQAGIVAWGIGCGDKTPGVYVDVAKFRDWIDQQMTNENLETTYYDANYTPSTLI